jgi:hypothetical protein
VEAKAAATMARLMVRVMGGSWWGLALGIQRLALM